MRVGSRENNLPGKRLKGHYQLVVECEDKSKEIVTPSNDWVVSRISKGMS
jgi:hypothetical protein